MLSLFQKLNIKKRYSFQCHCLFGLSVLPSYIKNILIAHPGDINPFTAMMSLEDDQ